MSKDPSTLLLEHHLKVLKLPTFVRDYASVATACAQERCDYPAYLLRLTERELIERERKAAERRIKDARFPVIKTISSFDFKAQASINEPLVRELLVGEYITRRENVLLVGNPGTGKTHLATAMGHTLKGVTHSELSADIESVMEIVIDGISFADIAKAMQVGIQAICNLGAASGVKRISAGNYGGKLGPHHFKLHEIMAGNI